MLLVHILNIPLILFVFLELPFKGLKRVVRRSTSEPDDGMDDNDTESGIEDQAPPDDNHTIIRLLEPNEKV
jgi:hypothetical protein